MIKNVIEYLLQMGGVYMQMTKDKASEEFQNLDDYGKKFIIL